MIALAPRDDVAALRLAALDPRLAGELQRRQLHRLGAAAHEADMRDARRRMLDEMLRQALGRFAREEARVDVVDGPQLSLDRRCHMRMAVPETGHARAAAGVEIGALIVAAKVEPLARDRDRIGAVDVAMQEAGHQALLTPS